VAPTPQTADSRRGRGWLEATARRPVLQLALFVVVSLATRWLSFVVDLLDIDEAAHIVGAWELERGGRLYRDFADNKPPLLYVYFLVAQWLLGRGLVAVHAFTALAAVPVTALGVSAFLGFGAVGLVGGLTYLLYSVAFIGHDMLATNAEIPMMAVGVWALVALRDERSATRPGRTFTAGLIVGTAVLFKYQIATWIGGLGGALVWQAWRRTRPRGGESASGSRRLGRPGTAAASSASLLAGFALPLVATWLVFARLGLHDDLIHWTLAVNLTYAANPISAREALERALAFFVPFLLVTVPLWWGAWRTIQVRAAPWPSLLLASVLAWTLPAAALGFRFFPHYFIQFYAPLAMAASPWILDLLERPSSRRVWCFLGWTAAMFAGFTAANAYLYLGPSDVYREQAPVFRAVGARLHADPCSVNASMFVWGYAPMFYYYAGLPAATRFAVLAQAGLTPYVAGNLGSMRSAREVEAAISSLHWDWLMEDLDARKVTYVIDTAPAGLYRWNHYPIAAYPRLERYLRQHFDPLARIDRVVIYRRKDCSGRGRAPRRTTVS
jgi:hypothetical protein